MLWICCISYWGRKTIRLLCKSNGRFSRLRLWHQIRPLFSRLESVFCDFTCCIEWILLLKSFSRNVVFETNESGRFLLNLQRSYLQDQHFVQKCMTFQWCSLYNWDCLLTTTGNSNLFGRDEGGWGGMQRDTTLAKFVGTWNPRASCVGNGLDKPRTI